MELSTLVDRLDARLETDSYSDVDVSANGLQVGPAEKEVNHAAFAVDAAMETFERAAGQGADLLVTHHGIVWDSLDRVTGLEFNRIQTLIDHDIALYVSHLPLDGHPEFGNAAGLAGRLELLNQAPFGEVQDKTIGWQGRLPEPAKHDRLREHLADALPVAADDIQVLDGGPAEVERVAIVTGSGAEFLRSAADANLDALITGEGKQHLYHEARELGLSVFLAGHYATETIGVRTLQSLVDGWGPETTFIEVPTEL